MTEPYYNISYGEGFNGVLNYSNTLVDGWLVNSFLITIYVVLMTVGIKSEWKSSNVSAVASLLCLITAIGLRLITDVNELTIYLSGIVLAISLAFSYIGRKT